MSADKTTLEVYGEKAAEYASMTDNTADPQLEVFIAALSKGAHVLDLGCGPGTASALMAKAGLNVDATDASAEMVALANARPDVTARIATFDDVAGTDMYDGIWANFSLLHAPRAAMPHHLAALRQALKPGGLFHIGMKTGTGEQRDTLGRLYAYYTTAELHGLLRDAGLTPFSSAKGSDKGLSGEMADWVTIAAHG